MQRRLSIALGLVHEPEILFLDEPQAGLDPQSRVLVRDYLRSLRGGMTVLITTHEISVGDYIITIGGWFPRVGDKIYPWDDLGAHIENFFVPTLVLTLPLAAIYTRLLRADMVQTLQADFVTLASAKGVPYRRILWVHALRNSLFSLVTAVGTQLGAIVGGAIVAETFFDLDGMGSMLVTSVLSKDLFTVQSTAAILVACVVTVNLIVDLMYAVIDPRIRQMRALA
jgi:ABC-type dipeptide/oligopeptide/nickel transport system permease component